MECAHLLRRDVRCHCAPDRVFVDTEVRQLLTIGAESEEMLIAVWAVECEAWWGLGYVVVEEGGEAGHVAVGESEYSVVVLVCK